MGTAAATARAAGPSQDLMEQRGRLSRSTPRHADDTTTRPTGNWLMHQSDARDSEPDYLLCLAMADDAQAGYL